MVVGTRLSIRTARSDGVSRASEARAGTPIKLQPQEGPLIAGWEVLFAFTEYAPPTLRFPALAAHKGSSEREKPLFHCVRPLSEMDVSAVSDFAGYY